jgi:dipeptidyl aminopeptidase/acylaminoacyl peptidase
MRTRFHVCVVAAVLAAAVLPALGQPQAAEPTYRLPPKVVVDILDAPPTPMVMVSPTRQMVALVGRKAMPSIAEMAEPMLRLAGSRVNPGTNGTFSPTSLTSITLKTLASGAEVKVTSPAGAKLGNVSFADNGRYLAFTVTRDVGIELWMADTATGQAKAITTATLNGTGGAPCSWLDDSSAMLCEFVPDGRGSAPAAPTVPAGPRVQETSGRAAPAPTFQDLLTSPHDERLYEHYFTSQLALVTPAGKRTPVGRPGIFATASMSPDGAYLLVARVKRPFSRLVTANGFPRDVEIWNLKGEVVRKIGEQPLGEGVPLGGVTTGPRSYRWVPTEPATVLWAQALDEGNPRNQVPHRDRVVMLKAPFAGEPTEWVKTEWRFGGATFTEKGVAVLAESERSKGMMRVWIVDGPGATPRKWQERNLRDRYGDPGTPMSRDGAGGGFGGGGFGGFGGGGGKILQSGDVVYLAGSGASPQGDRPFLDRMNLKTLATERIFQTDDQSYETTVALLTDDGRRLLTRYESPTEFPNYYVRDLDKGTRAAVTAFKDPAPQLTGIRKQLLTYERKDGVKLSATLYLPPDYKSGEKLPFVFWAYPAEFTDAATASQVQGSPTRFTTISGASHLFYLTQGYGVLDNPTMPIVGPGETANDTYVEQLVASAEAAVNKVVEMGVADRDRIGIAGHSYGAFMTANLLAHSDLFRAGVARSGAYNRSLTPFGFQNEQRTFWQVPQLYARMSPFWHANKVNEPILLIHGEADNNSGTFPIQSERFYMALKGHGATARYVTLPHESHGYAARESVLHTLAEMINWMDKWVKNAPPRQGTEQ